MEKRKCFWMMGYGVMQSILTKPATWTLTPRAAVVLPVRTRSIMRVPHWRIDFYHEVRMPSSARSDTLTWARSALKKRVYGWDQTLRSSTENSKLATAKIILFNDDIKINRKNKLIRKICLSPRKGALFVICFWSQTDENEAEQDFICFVSFDLIYEKITIVKYLICNYLFKDTYSFTGFEHQYFKYITKLWSFFFIELFSLNAIIYWATSHIIFY